MLIIKDLTPMHDPDAHAIKDLTPMHMRDPDAHAMHMTPMHTAAPKVLALSYYDGATEGFLDGMGDDQVYFFKVAAWNTDQDRRLYVLGQVARAIYLELLVILMKSQRVSASSTWAPTWVFANPEMEARANEIVEISKRSIISPACLALGADLIDAIKVVCPTPNAVASAIALAGGSGPGNLADWLAQCA